MRTKSTPCLGSPHARLLLAIVDEERTASPKRLQNDRAFPSSCFHPNQRKIFLSPWKDSRGPTDAPKLRGCLSHRPLRPRRYPTCQAVGRQSCGPYRSPDQRGLLLFRRQWPKADIQGRAVVADADSRREPLPWWPEIWPPCLLDTATIHDFSRETVTACLAAIGRN